MHDTAGFTTWGSCTVLHICLSEEESVYTHVTKRLGFDITCMAQKNVGVHETYAFFRLWSVKEKAACQEDYDRYLHEFEIHSPQRDTSHIDWIRGLGVCTGRLAGAHAATYKVWVAHLNLFGWTKKRRFKTDVALLRGEGSPTQLGLGTVQQSETRASDLHAVTVSIRVSSSFALSSGFLEVPPAERNLRRAGPSPPPITGWSYSIGCSTSIYSRCLVAWPV